MIKIQKNVPLAPLSTFNIGGKAKFFTSVNSPEKLIQATRWANEKNIPFKVFAGGSNVLFPDENLNLLVIQIKGGKIKTGKKQLTADAGIPLSKLIKKSISLGLSGIEKLIGIHGTVGGAIVGNAAAYGQSISDTLVKIEIWDGKKRRWLTKKQCLFAYRHSIFKQKPYLVLKAVFQLKKEDVKKLKKTSHEIIKQREEKFPPGIFCAGCFFKNIPIENLPPETLKTINKNKIVKGKIPTGYLLERVGAKNMSIGNAQVADFHANFIINKGNAKTADIKKIADILKEKVKEKFNIELEEEVQYF